MIALAVLPGAAAASKKVTDAGVFKVYQYDKALGTETFTFAQGGDSIVVVSEIKQEIPVRDGKLKLHKEMLLVANAFDYSLREYHSAQVVDDEPRLSRAVTVGDTLLSSYRESGDRGEGDRLRLPPGRLFMVDGQVFTLFDIICRNLSSEQFDERPVMIMVLGPRDSLYDATAKDLGSETIRWGSKPVVARKLEIRDLKNSFTAWLAPRTGHMLRLVNQENGLRVEREPPPVKPAAKRSGD